MALITKVIEILPLEQGLKRTFFRALCNPRRIVIEILPLEQGLKLKETIDKIKKQTCYRDTSIRTRIETILQITFASVPGVIEILPLEQGLKHPKRSSG